jgi:putative nucleotidyltransferase with HDIG domain
MSSVIDNIIDQVKALPPAPRILPDLLKVLRRDDSDASDVVRLIHFDPALTAQVLRRCNSAYYGFAEPVRDLQVATLRIGLQAIYRTVAQVVGERTLGAPQSGYGIQQGELSRHSAVTALAAQIIATELGLDQSGAFTAALLHDLGKLVLSTSLDEVYDQVIARTEQSGETFIEAEKTLIGVDHAEVGGRLLERWSFPADLIGAVRFHHDPAQAGTARPLAACVHLGDVLAHTLGHGYGFQSHALRCQPEALAILEITPADLEQLLIKTAAGTEEMLAAESSTP